MVVGVVFAWDLEKELADKDVVVVTPISNRSNDVCCLYCRDETTANNVLKILSGRAERIGNSFGRPAVMFRGTTESVLRLLT